MLETFKFVTFNEYPILMFGQERPLNRGYRLLGAQPLPS